MAASQGCTGLGVWPYSEGSLVMVKDPYARENLREKAKIMLWKYLAGSLIALVGFLSFARFVIEPVLAPREESPGVCPIGSITNTTCNDRGVCNTGMDYCICGEGFGVYEGKTCESLSPAFIIGVTILSIFALFSLHMMNLTLNTGDSGHSMIFTKEGKNKYRMAEEAKAKAKKMKDG
ncbi:hypothetical protein TL16_g06067 [Triparma laevis f. inornata]|uniref:Uncharacterized protein n=2 Tax=Triparma laevis TaxID=1534972 RepID=A0A9W6ZK63_9STRA|nr:hypothetical protein TrLO_g7813 [Triparma laevis f. longispina]GMH73008.1 hypothetical protein TL16_g06067 [Triparma laevis f. inornata]